MARELLPADRRDWKAAGVLAYTLDERGMHLLLGKIDQRSSYFKAREEGWWILGAPDLCLPLPRAFTAHREGQPQLVQSNKAAALGIGMGYVAGFHCCTLGPAGSKAAALVLWHMVSPVCLPILSVLYNMTNLNLFL